MNPLRDALMLSPDTDLVRSDQRRLTRSQVLQSAGALAEALGKKGVRRCLLRSADPAELLVGLVACQESGTDLVLAHAHLKGEHVERLGTTLQIDAVLG